MPRTWTVGQTARLKTINKGTFTGYNSTRQVGAIKTWLGHNMKTGGLAVFTANNDTEMRALISDIAEYLGMRTGDAGFQAALRAVGGTVDARYREVLGTHGRVPAEVVEEVCVKYRMQRDVIAAACNTMAAAQGANGIKTITHATYKAELKLLPMGDERIYASTQPEGKYLFNKVAKHL